MTLPRYGVVVLFLPLFAVSNCRKQPTGEGLMLPQDPNQASGELRDLWRAVHLGGKLEQEKARGKLLRYLRPGMGKEHVEVWMGKPAFDDPAREMVGSEVKPCRVATYYCWIPGIEGKYVEATHLMTIIYEEGEDGLRMVSVEGPHFPD